MNYLLTGILLVFLLLSCDNISEKDKVLRGVDLAGTEWKLVKISDIELSENPDITINFDEGNHISGSAGCNRYFSTYEFGDSGFKISAIGSTRRMCPEEIMDKEYLYLESLSKSTTITLENDKLIIATSNLEKPLMFSRVVSN